MYKLLIILLLLCTPSYAQEVLSDFNKDTLPVLNDGMRSINKRIKAIEDEAANSSSILTIDRGGTGSDLSVSAPSGLLYLPATSDSVQLLSPGTGLTVSGTSLIVDSDFIFLSSTSPSGVADTGAMTITIGKTYLVTFNLATDTSSAVLAIRVNNISSNTYEDVLTKNGAASSGAASSTEITIGDVDNDGFIQGQFFIRSYGDNTTAFINGMASYVDSATAALSIVNFGGISNDGSSVSSVKLIVESGTGLLTGNVYLYELANS